MGTSEIEPSVSAETVEKVVSKSAPGERIRRKSKASGHRDGSRSSSKGKRSSSDGGRPSSFSKIPEGAKSPGRLSRKVRSSSDASEPHRHGSRSRVHHRSGGNDSHENGEGEGSSSEEESSFSSEEPDYMKTPGSTYSRSSKSLHLSAGGRSSSPSMPPSDGPSSSRGQRRKIKYQAGSRKSHPQEEEPSQAEFEVSNTSGNISTWEMRQRFQREFPNEPVPSDVILRQLYKADKIAAYERIERYKQEFPGEPVPSDEVLKKLYAPVASASATPRPPAPPPMTHSPPSDTGPQMLNREQLLTRQDSESNMTFATEAGWENYGAPTKPKSAVPLSIGMMALEEGDEDEEATARGSQSVRSAPLRAPMPSFEDFMNIGESSAKQQPVKFNNAPLTSSSTHSSGWTPKGFQESPSAKPTSTATTADCSWDASFIPESPVQVKPKSETRRPKSESNFIVKGTSDFDGSLFKSSKHGRQSPPGTAMDAFHDSFNSGNSFGDDKPASSGDWDETPDLGKIDTDGVSSVGKGSSKKKDKAKTRSGKKKKEKEKEKEKEKKPKKKKEKTDEKKQDKEEEENASSSDDDFFKPKGAPVRKSWWNLDAPETLSPGPDTGALERRKTEAWKKREAWKKTARTQSAPLKKHQLADSFENSFQGDVFADFNESASHLGLQPNGPRKPARRGKKQLDNSCHEIGFNSSVAGNDPFDEFTTGRSVRQSRTALDSSTHSGPKGAEESFGSFDAFGSSVGNLQRMPPTRSKSADDVGFDSFFDITETVEEEPSAFPGNGGALAPSKREQRQARTTELLRDVRNGNTAPSNSQRRNQQGLVDLNGWESEIPSLFRQAEDGVGLELEVGLGDDPMSPLTVRTKTAIHRPLTARRRGHALR